MKIKKIKVSNFRNLKNIDIEFWNINILTWKNSSWKTNFTQLITNCLNTNDKVKDFFWENITTFSPWVKKTIIETTIIDLYNIYQTKSSEKIKIIKPIEFTFKNIISKKTMSSQEHILDYVWDEYEQTNGNFIDFDTIIDWKIEFNKITKRKIYNKAFTDENNSVLKSDWWYEYFDKFKRITEKSIINMDNSTSFSACLSEIYSFITKRYDLEKYKDIVDRINQNNKIFSRQNFSEAGFINLLWDIQSNKVIFNKFNDDLNYFTNWIIKKVEINMDWSKGFRGDIFIQSPNWPNEIAYVSSWSSIILYFVTIKNWLDLNLINKSYLEPSVMIFDELDSAIHPSLINKFSDLLKIISSKLQLFITTHSTNFIDCFDKKDLYLLKDIWSFYWKVNVDSNILSYKTIIDNLSIEEKEVFWETINSELYINWFIDNLFPLTLEKWVKK